MTRLTQREAGGRLPAFDPPALVIRPLLGNVLYTPLARLDTVGAAVLDRLGEVVFPNVFVAGEIGDGA